ncbi:MAG: MFS transporter [Anaerolineales bacterium]
MSNTTSNLFIRTRITWLAYFMLAYIGFSQAILGPLMPFLRSELNLNYTQGGFFSAAIACGLILTGLFAGGLTRCIPRQILFWSGGTLLAIGITSLSISHRFELALLATVCMGIGGSMAQVMIQAILSDQHGEQRAIALTEANVAASLSGTLTPLVLSSLQRAGIDWRAIAIITIIILALLSFSFRRERIPNSAPIAATASSKAGSLPVAFWLYWIVLFFMVAAEMCLSVWSTDFFISIVGLSRADAVLAFGAFPAAMLTGRFAGSQLTRSWSALTLLFSALGLTLIGLPLFWLARIPALNILGLFITGLGVANQYPLTMSMALSAAGEKTNQASARVTLAVGIALLSMPLTLGKLADAFGLQKAFIMIILLMFTAFVLTIINNRSAFRKKVVTVLNVQ